MMGGKEQVPEGISPSEWARAKASRAHVVVDAGPYFELMREAMLGARQRILLIGWDFDTRIKFGSGRQWWNVPRKDIPPRRLGPFILWLADRNPDLDIRILKWNFGALKALFRGKMVIDLLRWWWHPNVHFKLDSAHPIGCSHHQKIVVIDDEFAVCGGIDMAGDRWDTRDHLDADPRRKRPSGRLYGPWHDCTMMLEGEIAETLGSYARMRWRQATGETLEPCEKDDRTIWPERLRSEFHDVDVGISRTRAQYNGNPEVREVERLFCEQIGRARRFIYAENQYFASRTVAEAIAAKLKEPDPPEIVLVLPESSDGWLEQTAMDGARVRLFNAVKEVDHAGRFSMWHPYNAAGTPIYVHSKMMIVDDEIVRVGSANMNNRSMGLDSECDVFIDCAENDSRCSEAIARLRFSLLAEHCGLPAEEVAGLLERHGSMAAMIEAAPGGGQFMRRFVPRELSETEEALADNEVLDPERPEEMLNFYRRGHLFNSRILKRPRKLVRKLKR
ncbi:phospholipase D-like domain-containing protein [Novosphingobium sp. ZN18A2]|uniref:phospholipase D-like domain-containing protein n=1 Tax=Novosphingobium sp. ZN18A2 TaxID=3079861 RepID=UPI0030D5FEDE